MKKLLFLAGGFNPKEGGIQRYNLTMLTMLLGLNVQVKALSLNDKSFSYNDIVVKGFNRNFFVLIPYLFFQLLRTDIVLLGHRNFLPLMKIIRYFRSIKSILIMHGIEIWEQQKQTYIENSKLLDHVWSVSLFTSEKFKENFNSKVPITLIPNVLPEFVDVITADELMKKHNQPDKIIFLSVSRLSKSESYKGLDMSLKAVEQFYLKTKLNFEYHLVTHGDDVDRHKEIADHSLVRPYIIFHSNLTDLELKHLYRQAHIFILPSTGEGFGIVYLEAMANGCICIAANAGGVKDFIIHLTNGLCIEAPVSLTQIEKQIIILTDSSERVRLGLSALQTVKEYHIDHITNKVENAIESLG